MLRSTALFLAVLPVPATLAAQTQIGLGFGYSIVSGDSYLARDDAITLGGHLSYGISDVLQIGVGFDYSSFGIVDEAVGDPQREALAGGPEDKEQIDILATARYLFPSDAVRFFVGGKVGFTRQSSTFMIQPTDEQGVLLGVMSFSILAKGFAIGPTVGVHIAAGSVAVELSADGLFHSYGVPSVNGDTVQGSDGLSGSRVVPRVAIAIPIGG